MTTAAATDSFTISGPISGAGGLSLNGPGAVTLSGANTYSGTTTVNNILPDNGGANYNVTLNLYGSLSNSPMAIQSGVLAMAGTIGQNVTMSGGGIDDRPDAVAPLISGNLTVTGGTANWYSALTTVAGGVTVQNGLFLLGNGAKLNTPTVTINGGALSTLGSNVLSSASAVAVNGGTLNVSGNAQSIQSLSMGSLGTLNLGVGYLLSVSGSAGLAGTLDIIGSNSITSLPYALMTYSGSPTGTFGNVVGLPSTDKLSYGSGTLDIVASVNAPNYTLTATVAAHRIISGGSTGVSVTLTNAGGGQSPDNINFSGLSAVTGANGTVTGLASSGSNLAYGGSSASNTVSFTSSLLGSYTITPTATVTGVAGTLPALTTSTTDAVTVVANRTVTASAITGLRVIQGQTASGISTLATSDPGNGDLTAASNTQFTVYNPANSNSVGLFGTTSGGTIGAAVTASGPLGAGTIGTVSSERLRRRRPGRRDGHRPERGLLRPGCHQSHGHFQRDRLRPGPRGGGPQPKRHPLHQRRRQPVYPRQRG